MASGLPVSSYLVAFQLHEARLREFLQGPHGPVMQDLARRAIRVEGAAKRNATDRPGPRVRTGRLRGSITLRNARLTGDRTFVIGGRTFVHRPGIAPEVVLVFEGVDEAEPGAAVAILDEVIVECLEPEQPGVNGEGPVPAATAWTRVRKPEVPPENPITLGDMTDLIRWLMEKTTSRPTGQPSGSSPTDGSTAASSTDASASPAAAA
jgi:hypothetical protein